MMIVITRGTRRAQISTETFYFSPYPSSKLDSDHIQTKT